MRISLSFCLAAAFFASPLCSTAATFHVVIDTSSISGKAADLEFEFVAGFPAPASANALISGFASDAILGIPAPVGVSGTLAPGPLILNNLADSDFFQPLTLRNSIVFDISLPDPMPSSGPVGGNTLGVFLYNADGPLLTTDFAGRILEFDQNASANPTDQIFSAQTTVGPAIVTPEPATALLYASGLALLTLARHKGRLLYW